MKRTIKFLDDQRNKVVAECKITKRNGYPEFTMSGEYNGGAGQCFDHVQPATDAQHQLIDLWRKWHLNGMSAGTPEQQAIIKEPEQYKTLLKGEKIYQHVHGMKFISHRANLLTGMVKLKVETGMDKTEAKKETLSYLASEEARREIEAEISISARAEAIETREKIEQFIAGGCKYDYDIAVLMLKMNGKYTVTHPDKEELFTYGRAWYKMDLPENFEEDLNTLLDEVEEDNEGEEVTEYHAQLFEGFKDPEACHALAIMLELNISEVDDITEYENYRYCVQGIDYLCGTDEEMDEPYDESLDNYLDECVLPELPETAQQYFDREAWKVDAKMGGRAHSLNYWDGSELNEGDYYAYRQ